VEAAKNPSKSRLKENPMNYGSMAMPKGSSHGETHHTINAGKHAIFHMFLPVSA